MPDIDFDQESALAMHNRGSRQHGATQRRQSKDPTERYSGLSLRASITVKASGAPPRVEGIWLPAWGSARSGRVGSAHPIELRPKRGSPYESC